MSLPFYKVACTGCDFSSSFGFGINYEYEGPQEHKPSIGRVWCKSCDSIEVASFAYTEKGAELDIEDLELWVAFNKKGFFAKYSKSKKIEIQKTNQEIQAVRTRLKYFKDNEYVPRCLSCGGCNVFSLSFPSLNDDDEQKDTGIQHSCGGNLLISWLGRMSFSSPLRKVVFNKYGVILNDERK